MSWAIFRNDGGVLKGELYCYVCGEPIPQHALCAMNYTKDGDLIFCRIHAISELNEEAYYVTRLIRELAK